MVAPEARDVSGVAAPTDRDVRPEAAFTAAYRAHVAPVTRYVARRYRGDVADVVEDVFVIAWRRRNAMPTEVDAQLLWFFGVARRTIANRLRMRRRSDAFTRSAAALAAPGSGDGGVAVTVHAALARLRREDREILMLVAWDGLSLSDAAHVLNVTPAAATKRLAMARASFARYYSADGSLGATTAVPARSR